MQLSRRDLIAVLGVGVIAGCNQTSTDSQPTNTWTPDNAAREDRPTTTGTIDVTGPTYELGDSFTREFDLTRGPEYGITRTVLLDVARRGTISYSVTVETSAEEPYPIDVEILPHTPGNLWGYLNYEGYTFEPEASAPEVTDAEVTATLEAGEYVFVVDNSRFGSSFHAPRRPLDRVTATVDCDLTASN